MLSRGFMVAKGFENKGINLPKRATTNAAGYDFEAAEDVVIPSIWKSIISNLIPIQSWKFKGKNGALTESDIIQDDTIALKSNDFKTGIKPTLVATGIKAYMADDEVLNLFNRSSNPLKSFILLANGVGVIDSDYFENVDNDGHIMFQFLNFGLADKKILKGERIGQGVFAKFLKIDDDVNTPPNARIGGFGSTSVSIPTMAICGAE